MRRKIGIWFDRELPTGAAEFVQLKASAYAVGGASVIFELRLRALALRGNTMKHLLTGIALVIGLIGLAGPSAAKVVKFEILRTESPAFEGRRFGTVGTYDRIVARATIAVAPGDPHNSIVVDIDRAPRNEQGLVEAVSDVEILRPTIAANGNR